MKHKLLGLAAACCLFSLSVQGQDNLQNAYYQRNYMQMERLLKEQTLSPEQQAIWQSALAVAKDADDQNKQLEALTRRYPDNAEVHYQAGRLWYEVKEQSSFINKLGYIDRHVKHMLRAYELEPDNPKYMREAAKALAWDNLWGWDKEAAKALVERLAQINQQYHLLAAMDYAQNTQNQPEGQKLIAEVLANFSENVPLMERAAQLQLTYDQKADAQQSFYQTCLLTPKQATSLPIWRDACQWSGYLSLEGFGSQQQGLQALTRLLSEDQVYDDYYVQSLLLQAELAESAKEHVLARQSYLQAQQLSTDQSVHKDIRRALKRLSQIGDAE
ncbi:hypothetical protein GCM10009092_30030 [Bowmanella denitrificans]|uniref:Uncharacterized protein n=1 Tax=Bowmanella denitrificans TaxID=366582 RepID=A0ABN0XGP6_9ALTE